MSWIPTFADENGEVFYDTSSPIYREISQYFEDDGLEVLISESNLNGFIAKKKTQVVDAYEKILYNDFKEMLTPDDGVLRQRDQRLLDDLEDNFKSNREHHFDKTTGTFQNMGRRTQFYIQEVEHALEATRLHTDIITAHMISVGGLSPEDAAIQAKKYSKNILYKPQKGQGYDFVIAYRLPVQDGQGKWIATGDDWIIAPGEVKTRKLSRSFPFTGSHSIPSDSTRSLGTEPAGGILDEWIKSKQHSEIVEMVSDRTGLSIEDAAILQEQMVGKMISMQEGLYLYGSSNGDLLSDFIIKKVPGDITPSSSPIHYLFAYPGSGKIKSQRIEMSDMETIMRTNEADQISLLPTNLRNKLYDEDGNLIETIAEFRKSFVGGSGSATQNRLIPSDTYLYTGSSWIENWNYIEKYSEVSEVDLSAITRQVNPPDSIGGQNYQFRQHWTRIRTLTFEVIDENGNKVNAKLPYRVQKVDAHTYGVGSSPNYADAAKDEVKYLNNNGISTSDELVSLDGSVDNRFIALNHAGSEDRPIDMMGELLEPVGNLVYRGSYDASEAWAFPIFKEILPSTNPKTWEKINYKMVFDEEVTLAQAKQRMEKIITGTYNENMEHYGLTGIEYDLPDSYIDILYQTRGSSVKPTWYRSSIYSTTESQASDIIDPSRIGSSFPRYPALGGTGSDYFNNAINLDTHPLHNVVVNPLKKDTLRQKQSYNLLLEYFNGRYIQSLDRGLTFEEAEYFANLLSGYSGFSRQIFDGSLDGLNPEEAMSGDGIEIYLRNRFDLSGTHKKTFVDKTTKQSKGYVKGQLNNDIAVLKDFFDDDFLSVYRRLIDDPSSSAFDEVHEEILGSLIGRFREVLTDILDDQVVVLNAQTRLNGKLLPRSGIMRELVPIDANDLGGMFDEYYGSLNRVQILLSDPSTKDDMRCNIVRSVIHNDFDNKITQLKDLLVKNSEKTYVNVNSLSGNTTSRVAYKYHISHTYMDQPVQFDILFTNDLTSVYIMDGLNYIAKPILIQGGWNPELFVASDFTGNLQDALDAGKLPRANFNQKDDPMNFLKLVVNLKSSEDTISQLDLIDEISGIFDLIASNMRPDLFSVFMVKYEDLLKQEMVINNDLEIFNAKTGTNSTWVDFFDKVMLSQNKDMFRSSNPVANQKATNAFANQIYRDQILNDKLDDKQVYNGIIGSKGLFDNEFSDQIFETIDGSSPSYNDFYYEEINSDGDQVPLVNIWQYVDPFGFKSFVHLAKSDYSDPFDKLGDEKQSLHNFVGSENVDFVYPSIAINNAIAYERLYYNYYSDLGLISPNRGLIDRFTNSFDLSFSLDFFRFGVRNNYGTLPVLTKYYFEILTNSDLYYNQGVGNYLLEYAYSSTMYSY